MVGLPLISCLGGGCVSFSYYKPEQHTHTHTHTHTRHPRHTNTHTRTHTRATSEDPCALVVLTFTLPTRSYAPEHLILNYDGAEAHVEMVEDAGKSRPEQHCSVLRGYSVLYATSSMLRYDLAGRGTICSRRMLW